MLESIGIRRLGWQTATDTCSVNILIPATCTAEFTVCEVTGITAYFTWDNAIKDLVSGKYAEMDIADPDTFERAYYIEYEYPTGNHTLNIMPDKTGVWECIIYVYNGTDWNTSAGDTCSITLASGAAEFTICSDTNLQALFAWSHCIKDSGSNSYAEMTIKDPTGVVRAIYTETTQPSGSHYLNFVPDMSGDWECELNYYNGQ